MPDVRVENHGTVFRFVALSDEAEAWIEENVEAEPWQFMGGLVVDHGYAAPLAAGMQADGLEVV